MEITIRVTKNFGNEAIYPACGTSRLMCELTGSKTLTRRHLSIIRTMGYEIKAHGDAFEMPAPATSKE